MKSSEVRKAVVLAAGYGKRLGILTQAFPKPLLPIAGEPMIYRAIRQLVSWGVREIAVNAHWHADQIAKAIHEYALKFGGDVRITISEEKDILGTGGALKKLRGFLGEEPFWLVNGDVVTDGVDPQKIADAYVRSGNFVGALTSDVHGPRTIEADPEGRVCNWHSDVPGDCGTYTYCGVSLLNPRVVDYLPEADFCSIVDAYEKAMMTDGRFVVGTAGENVWWADCGTQESYLEAEAALEPDRFEANPNIILPGVKLLESADLAGCVVTGGLIGGAFLRSSIVGLDQLHDEALKSIGAKLGWKAEDVGVEFLCERGSNRSFWRFIRGDARAIVIKYDPVARPENARYAPLSRLLDAKGIAVVRTLAEDAELNVLAIEDLGAASLQTKAQKKGADMFALYEPVLKALRKFNEDGVEAVGDAELEPGFGPELYKWERDLFETHCLKERFGYEAMPAQVRAELETVARELSMERPVLVHRDFQSSNVLYRGSEPVFIDFQGMRLGPAAYDVASLVYDPYVPLCERDRERLAKVYPVGKLHLAAVERLVQSLGAFGRLASVGKPEFGKYVLPALQNLLEAADNADLDAVGGLAEDLIAKEMMRYPRPHHHHDDDDDCDCGHE